MKNILLQKFNDNLTDLSKITCESDRCFFYAFGRGLLAVFFEMSEFTQEEYDDLCELLDRVDRSVWLTANVEQAECLRTDTI